MFYDDDLASNTSGSWFLESNEKLLEDGAREPFGFCKPITISKIFVFYLQGRELPDKDER